jgi:hypothetical protein
MRLDLSMLAALPHLVALQITARNLAVTWPARLELVSFKVQVCCSGSSGGHLSESDLAMSCQDCTCAAHSWDVRERKLCMSTLWNTTRHILSDAHGYLVWLKCT